MLYDCIYCDRTHKMVQNHRAFVIVILYSFCGSHILHRVMSINLTNSNYSSLNTEYWASGIKKHATFFSKLIQRCYVNFKDLYKITNADGPNNRLLSHEIDRGNDSWLKTEDVLENEQDNTTKYVEFITIKDNKLTFGHSFARCSTRWMSS